MSDLQDRSKANTPVDIEESSHDDNVHYTIEVQTSAIEAVGRKVTLKPVRNSIFLDENSKITKMYSKFDANKKTNTEEELQNTLGYEWLRTIQYKIFEKYGIEGPTFILTNQANSKDELVQWFNRMIYFKRFVKYKKVNNSSFELKSFFPSPSDQICNSVIQETFSKDGFSGGSKPEDCLYAISWYDTIYSFNQIKREALFAMKTGHSELQIFNSKNKSKSEGFDGKVFEIMPDEPGIYPMLQSGYLELEYED
jgi:hypothetical protein